MNVARCPKCQAKFDISQLRPGAKIACGRCKNVFVPESPADEPAPAPSEPAAPARKAVPRPAGRTSRAGGRAVRSSAAAGAVPAGRSRTVKIAAGVAGLVLVSGAVLFLALHHRGSGEAVPLNDAASSGYERKKAAADFTNVDSVLQLALWCEAKQMPAEFDENLALAFKLNPQHAGLNATLRDVLQKRLGALAGNDADGHWALVEWCDRFGMTSEADKTADLILKKIDKNHAQSNQRFGRVLFEGSWEDKDMVQDFVAMRSAAKSEAELLAQMKPRQQQIYKLVKELKAKREIDFEYLDTGNVEMPYLICVQKSSAYDAAAALSSFGGALTHLYKSFFTQYGKRFDLSDLQEEIMVVFVYDSRATYRKMGGGLDARGHFSPGDKEIRTWNEPRTDPRETLEVIFHEGVHQLVDRITTKKGGQDAKSMFWFTEGIATYFEHFKRLPDGGFELGAVSTNWLLPACKAMVRAKACIPLEEFVDLEYQSAMIKPMDMVPLLYAEAWSFTHFLYKFENGKYRSKFEDYFLQEMTGKGGGEAFKEIFGDMAKIEEEWKGYVDKLK